MSTYAVFTNKTTKKKLIYYPCPKNGNTSAKFSDITTTSFNGNKIITTSGGGALVCDNQKNKDRARRISQCAEYFIKLGKQGHQTQDSEHPNYA